MGVNIEEWTYVPEFTRDEDAYAKAIAEGMSEGNAAAVSVRRGNPPTYVHVSGARVNCSATSCLTADMLDAEGKSEEADTVRAACSGDAAAFQRLLEMGDKAP
jgi:hypothetical protein